MGGSPHFCSLTVGGGVLGAVGVEFYIIVSKWKYVISYPEFLRKSTKSKIEEI